MAFDIWAFLMATGAGIFGAAIGGILGFFFVGVLVVLAVAAHAFAPGLSTPGQASLFGALPFGMALGPHVAGFASGVFACAYLGKKGTMSGRDITTAPVGFNDPMALVMGAVAGAFGYICFWVLNFGALSAIGYTDKVAFTVVLSAVVARLAFGKTGILGKRPAGATLLGRPPAGMEWLPWQQDWPQVALIALGAACLGAYLCKLVGPDNGGMFLGFGISAMSLVVFFAGAKPPVTHQGTLIAAEVFAVTGGSWIWAIVLGFLATIVAEFFSRFWLVYGDTHIDPPACAIAFMTTVWWILLTLGVFAALPLP